MIILPNQLDANEVYPNIYVGSKPPKGNIVFDSGFSYLVLCAEEYQLPAQDYNNVTVVHAPFEDIDAVLSTKTMNLVFLAARTVAEIQKSGAKILVTCAAGINRSALVAAIAIRMLGNSGEFAVECLRSKRNINCLSNVSFLRIVLSESTSVKYYLK